MVDTTIPQRTAIRGVVPGTYDPLRRPGSSGQRYFSDIAYVNNVDDPAEQRTLNLAEQAMRNEQATGLAALNASNPAMQQRPATLSTATAPSTQVPYYTPSSQNASGISNFLDTQKSLVSEASRRLPVGMTPAQRSVTGALQDAPNDMVARLLDMGIFTPETAAQFYQSRYPGLTAEQVQEALGQYGYAQGGDVQGDLPPMYDENGNPALAGKEYRYLTTEYNMGPMDPASEEGRREIDRMERTRRRESTRTPLEYLADMLATDKAADELRLGNDSADRRRFNRKRPNFLGRLEDLKEARERIIKEQDNRYAQGGIASVAPQGMYLGGPTDGMADQIPATIDNKQPAALSDGEFVVPADVVSHLGNGNSDAGAQNLYSMMERVRKARTGNPEQGRQIDPNKYLA